MRKKIIDIGKCTGCRNCELACIAVHSPNEDIRQAYAKGGAEAVRARCKVALTPEGQLFPQHCRHCKDPRCVEACPNGALQKREDGYVICDTETCLGCYLCVMSCPYGYARPATSGRRMMIKCDGCAERDCMACVKACPTGCLSVTETEDSGDIVTYVGTPDTEGGCA
jgi:carbon-monoxide dehydrogenase iron sulfur subunit